MAPHDQSGSDCEHLAAIDRVRDPRPVTDSPNACNAKAFLNGPVQVFAYAVSDSNLQETDVESSLRHFEETFHLCWQHLVPGEGEDI